MGLWRRALTSMNATILSSKQSLGFQLKLQPEKDIFLFNAKESVANWTASSDRSIGGLSECKWGFYKGAEEKDLNEEEVKSKRLIHAVKNQDNVPSAVFAGRLSMDCQPTEVGVVRSGYCAVRASVPSDLLLHGYEGITMRIMTDGRQYRMNVQMESWNPFNLYMGFIRTPPNEWVDVTLPFRDFLLTAKGFVKLDDETELDPSKLKSVGFAIADQKEGDFEMRIQWIKAVAQLDPSDKDDRNNSDDDDDRYDNSKNSTDYFRKPADLVI
ncbi:Complex I intermediate-associated protein 30, mitochondrial precursor [Phytophthora cinnamomi]|uniref:Complex I intermediate-associated protein 30, mitochondrial precursor n=1 Tax=Phytophthora cinnamomi TaxID=4785 RepID=UPI003559AB46|nr:Complex I intermediate-associated protein 30, mitochondrial precursor [Phytophthora cinnamomi]